MFELPLENCLKTDCAAKWSTGQGQVMKTTAPADRCSAAQMQQQAGQLVFSVVFFEKNKYT